MNVQINLAMEASVRICSMILAANVPIPDSVEIDVKMISTNVLNLILAIMVNVTI